MNTDRGVMGSAILALGLVVAASIASFAFYQVRALSNTLSVTGSATATTTADSAKWSVSVSRSAYEDTIASSQTRVSSDAQAVVNFFAAAGIAAGKIQVSPVFIDQEYSSDQNAPRRYTVREQISIQSDDPKLVAKLSKDISSLINRGILVSSQQPEYYIGDLPELRVSLIGKAVTDAKARAEEIAKANGQKVGALQSASSGVVQVMQLNSIEVSDYGSYDTSTIEKQVMVTTRAVFLIR